MQLMNAHDPETTEQRYLEVIYRKTAKLFEAGAEVAAVLAGQPEQMRRALAAYGRHLGTAYQLVDDVLDYRSNPAERGKNLGDDLAEGKPTLPLIHARSTAATHSGRRSARPSKRAAWHSSSRSSRRSSPPAASNTPRGAGAEQCDAGAAALRPAGTAYKKGSPHSRGSRSSTRPEERAYRTSRFRYQGCPGLVAGEALVERR